MIHAVAVEHGSLRPPGAERLGGRPGARPARRRHPSRWRCPHHRPGRARARPACSPSGPVTCCRHWNLPPSAVSLVAFNKRAQEEMGERTTDLPGLQVRTLNAIALAIVNGTPPFAPQPTSWRTIDEPDVRRIIGDLVSFPRRRNSDPIAPWIEALTVIRLGLVDPAEVEGRYDGDVDGLAEMWPRYRAALERRCVGRLRRPDLSRPAGPAARSCGPTDGAAGLSDHAGRRVPGPHAGAPAAHPSAVVAGRCGVRGRRRRPDHLRLQRRRPRVVDRLRRAVPRVRANIRSRSTTDARPGSSRSSTGCCDTTLVASPRSFGRRPPTPADGRSTVVSMPWVPLVARSMMRSPAVPVRTKWPS